MRREALDVVLQDIPAARRGDHIRGLLASAEAGQLDLDGLFVARRDTEILGAAWAYLQPGRVATVWPAVVRGAEYGAVADSLLATLAHWSAQSGAQLRKPYWPSTCASKLRK